MTKVIFRKWRNGDIIALFPELDAGNLLCESFERVGQHGAADYTGVVALTDPATAAEYAALHRELTGRGYELKVRQRA